MLFTVRAGPTILPNKRNIRKKVIAFGTFDVFHKGHESFLAQARKYGDYLVVVIGRDSVVKKVKGSLPRSNEEARLKKVRESRLADKVTLGHLTDMLFNIKKEKPGVIALGYDQTAFTERLADMLLELGMKDVKIVRLKSYRPGIYKSSKLRITNLIRNTKVRKTDP